MDHVVLRAVEGRLLFGNCQEASALWHRLTDVGLTAMVLMPDHVHLLQPTARFQVLGNRCSGYARWLNHQRGRSGQLFRPVSSKPVSNRQHLERSTRYIALNPCRAGLVDDPLAWPFSTHRDALGLAWPAVIRRVADPVGHHAYVSGDPTVAVSGTELPFGNATSAEHVFEALSNVLRITEDELRRCRKTRRLALAVARQVSLDTDAVVADVFGVNRCSLYSLPRPPRGLVEAVQRVAGDPRFVGLGSSNLCDRRSRYRSSR